MKRIPMIAFLIGFILLGAAAYWLWTPDKSRGELEAKYFAPTCSYRDVAGARLYICDSGRRDAPAIILLHGFGSSLQTWDAWAKSLEVDHRVIRFDLPGFGLSGADPTGDYSDSRSIRILSDLLRSLGLEHASFIGNSLGGRIAWKFAADQPARVEKLVLISPDGFASPGFEYGKAPKVSKLMTAMRFVLPKWLLRMNLQPAYGNSAALSDAVVTRYYDLMLAPGVRDAIIARMEQTVLENPVPLLRRIQAPTLLLWGQKDGMIPFANAAQYIQELPHGSLVPLSGLGHVPQEEAPETALVPVRAFLER